MLRSKPHIEGWVSVYDQLCTDKNTIVSGALKGNNGRVVYLLLEHRHKEIEHSLVGCVELTAKEEGLWGRAWFNNSPNGLAMQEAYKTLGHGSWSPYFPVSGMDKVGNFINQAWVGEVSIVLWGANPKAKFDWVFGLPEK